MCEEKNCDCHAPLFDVDQVAKSINRVRQKLLLKFTLVCSLVNFVYLLLYKFL
jgi:hypothetical protein